VAGREPVPKTQTHDRAGIRPHPSQQRCHTIPPKRKDSRAYRVAVTDDDPQTDQAPPPPDSHRGSLKRPLPWSHHRTGRAHHQRRCQHRATPASAARFERQPPSRCTRHGGANSIVAAARPKRDEISDHAGTTARARRAARRPAGRSIRHRLCRRGGTSRSIPANWCDSARRRLNRSRRGRVAHGR
jgi:hypothetical protein